MTENETLQDASIEHQIDLQQYANGVVQQEVGSLNSSDAEMLAALLALLLSIPPGPVDVATIDQRLQPVLQLNSQAYRVIELDLREDINELVEFEAQFQETLLRSEVSEPDDVDVTDVAVIFAALMTRPFMGVTLSEAMTALAAARANAIRITVRAGLLAGQSVEEVMRAIRGTSAASFSDGLLNTFRNHLETTIRTALAHAASYTREAVYALNKDLVPRVMWVSVLDSRTSPPCQARSNKLYRADTHAPLGHSIPWLAGPGALHFNCRSSSTPVLPGPVPDRAPSYAQWLSRQPAATQDRVLGPSRGRLYRQGSFEVDQFTNDKGRRLTLPQLRAKDAEAFAKAGIPLRYWRAS